MTTPRVYTVGLDNPDYIDTGKIAFRPTKERPTNVPMFIQAEVILLSDHKEVVHSHQELNRKLANHNADYAEENAALREKLLHTSVGLGHYKNERDIHIQESKQFVKEATEKIERQGRAIEMLTKQRDALIENNFKSAGAKMFTKKKYNEIVEAILNGESNDR